MNLIAETEHRVPQNQPERQSQVQIDLKLKNALLHVKLCTR